MRSTEPNRNRVVYPRSPSSRPIFAVAERLVEIWSRNRRALATLKTLEHRADRVRIYMEGAEANLELARACLVRIREQRREQFAVLRTGHHDALKVFEFLKGLESSAAVRSEASPSCTLTALTETAADMPRPAVPIPFPAASPSPTPADTTPKRRRYA
ncbi:hypothetical protein [Aquisphaera insulae]|uniref:hypothetical protein n=1 Tax=Aquisphaera insulae TaxID=2712864 RepID=UPI0013ED8F03|nr:hypothetical protein [Aquisphaera insulae]